MKVTLKAGAEADLLSPSEARDLIYEAHDLYGAPPTELVRAEESGKTDAAGGLVLPAYVVPPGMECRVHLACVEADGFTEAVPFNAAGAFFRLQVSGRKFDGASLVAGAVNGAQIPFTRQYGEQQGGVGLNGEAIELVLVAGPANTLVRFYLQGTLIRKPGFPPER